MKNEMDILSQENKYRFLIILILFLTSCNNDYNQEVEIVSKKVIGKTEYGLIHKLAKDSIQLWSSLGLESYDEYSNGFLIDYLCFNTEKNKFVSCILDRCMDNCTQDYIQFFYGAKIKDTWYYFKGANIVLPREMYQKDVTKPLGFEKLHEIALKEVFSGYLKKKDKGFFGNIFAPEYEPDEAWFDGHFKTGYLPYNYRESPNYEFMEKDSTEPIFTNQEDYLEFCYKRSALGVWNSKK